MTRFPLVYTQNVKPITSEDIKLMFFIVGFLFILIVILFCWDKYGQKNNRKK